ncbi:prostaglandin E2 receptor EP4 subtype-like [Liolophura sinensis]|uniref:prostaglandin E2 receptor EP4 subtype-like n=1 Tax=Liolophura sinensis TaxID=3198878 RepID=UPI0031593A5C
MANGRDETKAPVSESSAWQDVSGTLSLIVEAALVVVNLFPILVVLRGKKVKERTVTDELVLALSITDILGVLVPTPIALMSYFDQHWQGGYETCIFFQVTTQCFQTVSILLVTYMCLDRFLVLRKALYYKATGVYSADKVKFFVLILYGVSLVVGSMPVSGLAPVPASRNSCESWITAMPATRMQATFYLTVLSLGYLNMFIVILLNICVISMVWKLKRKMQPLRGRSVANHIPELQIERKTIFEYSWMTLTVAVLFYLTWFPALVSIHSFTNFIT